MLSTQNPSSVWYDLERPNMAASRSERLMILKAEHWKNRTCFYEFDFVVKFMQSHFICNPESNKDHGHDDLKRIRGKREYETHRHSMVSEHEHILFLPLLLYGKIYFVFPFFGSDDLSITLLVFQLERVYRTIQNQ